MRGVMVKQVFDIAFSFIYLKIFRRIDRIQYTTGYSDLQFLFLAARRGAGEGAIVEIGSYKGKSTVALAFGSKLAGREKVFSIDPHYGGTKDIMLNNLSMMNAADYVVPIFKRSEEAAVSFDSKVRLLFIDGKHDYESVKKDILSWKDLVSEGGIISLHDYDLPDVARAIDELIKGSDEFIVEGTTGCSMLVSKAPRKNAELFDTIRLFNRSKRFFFPWKKAVKDVH
jgi:predicted O-methyltransferase YrrM